MNEIIVAQATPVGKGGVAIIRCCGDNVLECIKKIFNSKQSFISHKMIYGIVDTGVIKDRVMAVYFAAPHSYTGDNIVEIHCHGSQLIVENIISCLISKGCRLAFNGEFTRRAVLNNKLDLVQAESINDLINSDTVLQINTSNNMLSGVLSKELESISKDIASLLADVEAVLDYPEDIEYVDNYLGYIVRIESIRATIDNIASGYNLGRRIKNGVSVVVVGAANVGKSSLTNALLGYDRAIVTDIAGTTRDVVTDEYEYKGVKFILSDTAGIRETYDIVEKQGIDRTYVKISSSDIIISMDDTVDIAKINASKSIVISVQNKIDLNANITNGKIGISAKNGTNIEKLKQQIYNLSINKPNTTVINNQRHFDALIRASVFLQMSIDSLQQKLTIDIVAMDIRAAFTAIGNITGININKELLDAIFSKFCLGK